MESKSPKAEAFDVGVEYKYVEKGGIYGRFSRSYRFPATDEFYSRWTGLNTHLKQQKSDTWEVGVKDKNWKYLQPAVNFFWMDSQDEIFYDPTVGTFGDNRNYGKIRRFGIETAAKTEIFHWLDAFLSYTYLEAVFDDQGFYNKKVPMVPEHKLAWGINISPWEYILANFSAEYVGEQYSLNDQNNKMPKLKGYLVCSGKVTFKYRAAELFFGVNNIFNARYSEMAASDVSGTVTDLHPAPERNFIMGLSAKF